MTSGSVASSIPGLTRARLILAFSIGLVLLGAADASAGAIISNGTVKLGVNDEGQLNYVDPATREYRGVTYVPTGNDGTRADCRCEGWGAANVAAGNTFAGKANENQNVTVTPVSFTSTPSTATSVATIAGKLRVTHTFRPFAGTPNLYEIVVALQNIGGQALPDVRYTRVMDWDVEPTPFHEFVTIRRGITPTLRYSDDNGFADNSPLGKREPIDSASENADIVHSGPDDHGALFDFGLGALPVGRSVTFSIFYGATATEAQAGAAIAASGAEAFSYGQPRTGATTLNDTINTFIFGYRGPDTVPPDTAIGSGPSGLTNDATPAFAFSSTEVDSSFECRVDAGAFAPCTSPHTTAPLADGAHTFAVRATDPAGNTDPEPAARSFRVDATPPQTTIDASPTIDSGPEGTTGNPTPTFAFSSDEGGSRFECRVDSAAFASCSSPFTTGELQDGPHTFEVRAIDPAGNAAPNPASRRFTVARVVEVEVAPDRDLDTVVDPRDNCVDVPNAEQSDLDRDGIGDACDTSVASEPPEVGETVIARVVSGQVFVRTPGPGGARTTGRAAQAPPGFRPVRGAEVIPVGSTVDAVRGRLSLTSVAATTARGRTQRLQTADFYAGTFRIGQARARRPVTELALRSPDFAAVCGQGSRRADASAAQRRSRVVSRLWGTGRGSFRTRGRHSAATVRGTIWLTQERCDGTLTQVRQGTVSVRDQAADRTVTVRAGAAYLARARG